MRAQRFLIVQKHLDGNIEIIGTNGALPFVETSAHVKAEILRRGGGDFVVVEITRLIDFLTKE